MNVTRALGSLGKRLAMGSMSSVWSRRSPLLGWSRPRPGSETTGSARGPRPLAPIDSRAVRTRSSRASASFPRETLRKLVSPEGLITQTRRGEPERDRCARSSPYCHRRRRDRDGRNRIDEVARPRDRMVLRRLEAVEAQAARSLPAPNLLAERRPRPCRLVDPSRHLAAALDADPLARDRFVV